MPSGPPSRPKPGLLDAAERRRRVGDDALVEADHAGLQALDHAQGALDIARVDVGDEPELGVVGGGDRPRPRSVKPLTGATGPKISSREQLGVLRGRRRARWGRRSSRRRREPGRRPARGRPCRRVLHELGHLAALLVVDQRADLDALVGAAADLHRAHLVGQLLGELGRPRRRRRGSGWPPCTPRRRCASWRSSRPATAASRSASSKTMNGALPPSSIDRRSRLSEACAMRLRPTSVEPVKDSLRRRWIGDQRAHRLARGGGGDEVEHALAAGRPPRGSGPA